MKVKLYRLTMDTKKRVNVKEAKRQKVWKAINIIVLSSFVLGSLLASILAVYFGSQIKTPSAQPPLPVHGSASEVKKWRKIAKESPEDPFVLQKYAEALLSAGNAEKAKGIVKNAEKITPSDYRNEELLGEAELQEGSISKAILHFQKALKLNPKDKNLKLELQQTEALLKRKK